MLLCDLWPRHYLAPSFLVPCICSVFSRSMLNSRKRKLVAQLIIKLYILFVDVPVRSFFLSVKGIHGDF